eukprot:c98_g1_i1 orf=483-749(-)
MAGKGHLRVRNIKNGTVRLERHSGSGRLGTPKKGGAGGKHTWGVSGMETEESGNSPLDKFDPNYSDDDVEGVGDRNEVKTKQEVVAKF